jgi:hypothetical protein
LLQQAGQGRAASQIAARLCAPFGRNAGHSHFLSERTHIDCATVKRRAHAADAFTPRNARNAL